MAEGDEEAEIEEEAHAGTEGRSTSPALSLFGEWTSLRAKVKMGESLLHDTLEWQTNTTSVRTVFSTTILSSIC